MNDVESPHFSHIRSDIRKQKRPNDNISLCYLTFILSLGEGSVFYRSLLVRMLFTKEIYHLKGSIMNISRAMQSHYAVGAF